MTDPIQTASEVRAAFATLEAGLKDLAPEAVARLSKKQLAEFRRARRMIAVAHSLLAEIAEEINAGPEGEVVPLGGGT